MVLSGIDSLMIFSSAHNLTVLSLSNTEMCLHLMLPCLIKTVVVHFSKSDDRFVIPPSAKVGL
jgi:hypothetical protein